MEEYPDPGLDDYLTTAEDALRHDALAHAGQALGGAGASLSVPSARRAFAALAHLAAVHEHVDPHLASYYLACARMITVTQYAAHGADRLHALRLRLPVTDD